MLHQFSETKARNLPYFAIPFIVQYTTFVKNL